MADRFPLVVDSTNSNIKELPSGDNLDLTGSGLVLGGTAVTATGAELNLLDGVSGLVQDDLTKLAAVDATAAELNYLDTPLGTIAASKAVTADASGVISGIAKFGGGVQEAYTDVAINSGEPTLNLNDGTVFNLTLTENVDAGDFTWTNYAGADYASSFVLRVKQDGTGGRSLAWPSEVDWGAATAPELSTAANAVDIYVFLAVNNRESSIWYGFTAGQAIA